MKLRIGLLVSFLIIILYACKKESSPTENLAGKWYQQTTWDPGLVLQEEYNFKSDRTLDITSSVYDQSTKEIKGYVKRQTAGYSFKGDSLILKNIKTYSTGAHVLKPLNELIYTNTYPRTSYQMVYTANKNILTLKFYCPPNADCVPYPVLTRINY